ncbi:FAD-dependent monooxygenase [Streptomyces spororaveus]|uniref:Monooxygenase (salicylate/ hydroxybenzoate hydroxylase) n=1 Tax=Streptomyces spororaveus TaxID=284039 RepID=A0ABQ3TF17_9ACTN|nr:MULTISPECIES: FAD-dependent monooxygenase [Streptomyces]MCM9080635.1 FAD-dependent monooxygenase [Streptomyces spororaveus]MCX5304936.1 FAD-dependent monooxygenase [Streptomyces sp. NBC_00160]GHI79017.1 putative monooxygenase (salicylate/ hydroxybenzoate hydroxylase [Streptomyces spororaveus]
MSDADRVLVVGAGIGGLATALGVAARGHRVTVLERRAEVTEPGVGTQLSPNAFHALDRIGSDRLVRAVRRRAALVDELRFMDATTGDRIAGMPLTGRYQERFGNPYAVLHRGELHAVLLDACRATDGVELLAAEPVAWYEQTPDRVTAVTDSGRRFTGSALIAADGIRSAVRRQLVGDGDPRVSGHTIYHSVVPLAGIARERLPAELSPAAVTAWAGPGWHVVHFVHRTADGAAYLNLGATHDHGAPDAAVGLPLDKSHVLDEFPELAGSARALLELGEEWRTWVLCDRDPVERWTDGRVALLGNAAHPMLPYAVQGVSMTLEDAAALGELLDCDGREAPRRLARYEATRRDRTARTQLVARELGTRLFHPAGEAAAARDAMLAALTADELYDKVAWLHGTRDFTGTVEGEGN